NDTRMRVREIVPNLDACQSWKPEPCDYQPIFHYVNVVHYAVVVLACLSLGYRLFLSPGILGGGVFEAENGNRRLALFIMVLVAGVVVNGLICGALSEPLGRYQARVIWLIPLAAGLLETRLALDRRGAHPIHPAPSAAAISATTATPEAQHLPT